MNGGQFAVYFRPEPAWAKVARARSSLIWRLVSLGISALTLFVVWYFFREMLAGVGVWVITAGLAVGVIYVVIALLSMLAARKEAADLPQGLALGVNRDGVLVSGGWLTWPEIGAFRALSGRWGRSSRLVVEDRQGQSQAVPMDFLDALPATIDSAIRALSGGRHWIDLSRMDD